MTDQVIHRDIKPENVFVSGGHIRLGDFDISKPATERAQWLATELRTRTQVGGTLWYAAPELLLNDCIVGASTFASDLYSMGRVLFELVVPTQVRKPVDPFTARQGLGELRTKLLDLIVPFLSLRPQDRPSIDSVTPPLS